MLIFFIYGNLNEHKCKELRNAMKTFQQLIIII